MWVFHSVPREALTNQEDMRFQLLDYCYGVVNRTRSHDEGAALEMVPEDYWWRRSSRCSSSEYSTGCSIAATSSCPSSRARLQDDLVVVGANTRFAIECDGDVWHGPEEYEADLARQRELERCGWEFFRIRESVLFADMASSLKKLWETLDELDIRTADWIDSNFDDDGSDELAVAIDELPVDEALTDVVDAEGAIGASGTLVEEELAFIPLDAADASVAEIGSHGVELDPQVDLLAESGGGRHRADAPSDGELADDEVESVLDAKSVDVGRHNADQLDEVTTPAEVHELPPPCGVDVVPAPVGITLGPYVAFDDALPPINQTSLDVMAANVVRIVASEAPSVGASSTQRL